MNLIRTSWGLVIGLLLLVSQLTAQDATPDRLFYLDDEGKAAELVGNLKESVQFVEWSNAAKKSGKIPAERVLKLDPGKLAGVSVSDWIDARNQEESTPEKAAASYESLLKKVGPNGDDRTRRILTAREALASVAALGQKPLPAFNAEAAAVAEKCLNAAKQANKSWEIWPLTQSAARIFSELGEVNKATAAYRTLAGSPDLSKGQKQLVALWEAATAIRGRNTTAARGLLAELAKDNDFPKTGPLRDQLSVLQAAASLTIPTTVSAAPFPAEAAKKLQTALDAVTDPAAKGIGYLVLGDLHAGHKQPREALWMYLRVDVLYNQNVDDQALAIRRLVPLLQDMNEKEKAEEYLEKLTRVR